MTSSPSALRRRVGAPSSAPQSPARSPRKRPLCRYFRNKKYSSSSTPTSPTLLQSGASEPRVSNELFKSTFWRGAGGRPREAELSIETSLARGGREGVAGLERLRPSNGLLGVALQEGGLLTTSERLLCLNELDSAIFLIIKIMKSAVVTGTYNTKRITYLKIVRESITCTCTLHVNVILLENHIQE